MSVEQHLSVYPTHEPDDGVDGDNNTTPKAENDGIEIDNSSSLVFRIPDKLGNIFLR